MQPRPDEENRSTARVASGEWRRALARAYSGGSTLSFALASTPAPAVTAARVAQCRRDLDPARRVGRARLLPGDRRLADEDLWRGHPHRARKRVCICIYVRLRPNTYSSLSHGRGNSEIRAVAALLPTVERRWAERPPSSGCGGQGREQTRKKDVSGVCTRQGWRWARTRRERGSSRINRWGRGLRGSAARVCVRDPRVRCGIRGHGEDLVRGWCGWLGLGTPA